MRTSWLFDKPYAPFRAKLLHISVLDHIFPPLWLCWHMLFFRCLGKSMPIEYSDAQIGGTSQHMVISMWVLKWRWPCFNRWYSIFLHDGIPDVLFAKMDKTHCRRIVPLVAFVLIITVFALALTTLLTGITGNSPNAAAILTVRRPSSPPHLEVIKIDSN